MTALVRRLGPNAVTKICACYVALGLALVFALAAVGAPEWGVPLLAGTLILMLPFVLVLTWALEGRRFQGRRPRD